MKNSNKVLLLPVLALSLGLTACGGDDDDDNDMGMATPVPTAEPEMAHFAVTITNTTHNQPLSPPAVLLHDDSYRGWAIGATASDGLEVLAESGDPDDFIAEALALDSDRADGVLMPGHQVTLDVMAEADAALALTVTTMLVNTNDAFAGVTGWTVGTLAVEDSLKVLAPVYDAGTEANTETLASIPGPAAGGEGYNATRDDVDYVARHPGVVSHDDGLPDSALDQSHRFDNGAMVVTVTRM